MRTGKNRGFTLVETAAVVGMVSLLVGVMAPAVKQARVSARGQSSAANLAFIGQGAGMYAADQEGRIFSFTWSPGVHVLPSGETRTSSDDTQAARWQQTEILMRRTGRISGEHRFQNFNTRIPHHRTLLLVLQDYLDRPFPDPMVADPADANLLQWQANPTDISLANNIPYAAGAIILNGYDSPAGWNYTGVRQRWAFSSSYMSTVSAWNPYPPSNASQGYYIPVAFTPHLFSSRGNTIDLASGRNFAEVLFPSAKVHFFEEFDRSQPGSPYFGYDHARPDKLMFDGSVNDLASGHAAPSRSPALPNRVWRQNYVPLHTFPVPLSGLGEQTLLSQRYRWTYRGLKGLDYPVMAPKGAVAR